MESPIRIANIVARIDPGQWIEVGWSVLQDIVLLPGYDHPADRIMDNIVGSAYEFRWWEKPMTGDVTFQRLKTSLRDGRRTYVAPDRRHLFEKDIHGFWTPRAVPLPKPLPPLFVI